MAINNLTIDVEYLLEKLEEANQRITSLEQALSRISNLEEKVAKIQKTVDDLDTGFLDSPNGRI